ARSVAWFLASPAVSGWSAPCARAAPASTQNAASSIARTFRSRAAAAGGARRGVPAAARRAAAPAREASGRAARPARSRGLAQPWPQRGQVAGPGARIELAADDLFPRRAAGRGRAGQGEQEGRVGQAGERARLQRRGADLLERNRAEQFAEAGHLLVQQRQQRLGRGIATGETGAAGD